MVRTNTNSQVGFEILVAEREFNQVWLVVWLVNNGRHSHSGYHI